MKTKYLVADTTAFIQNAPLHEIAEHVVTVDEVIGEVKNKRQLRRLAFLTYDVDVKDVFAESIVHVTEFSKLTGDYPALSATDIKVLALAYQLEKQHVGVDHLRTRPVINRVIDYTDKPLVSAVDIAGFYLPKKVKRQSHGPPNQRTALKEEDLKFASASSDSEDNFASAASSIVASDDELDWEDAKSSMDEEHTDDEGSNSEIDEVQESSRPAEDIKDNESGYEDLSNDDEDDDDGWITQSNFSNVRRDAVPGDLESKEVIVGCLTTDFAMQNVLKQMGLNLIALDGRVIKEMRTFILRCYACFKTTPNMKKVFCPHCGNKTLKRVAVSLDSEGKQVIHINTKRPLSMKGKRYSLPMPKGGKHAVNPRLVEDARRPHQRQSKLARAKTDALHPDYIANTTPFVARDIYSRSAYIGTPFKYWMQKNPNEPKRRPKNK